LARQELPPRAIECAPLETPAMRLAESHGADRGGPDKL
jgi:hypothetical protein